jgi:hypothetical protein
VDGSLTARFADLVQVRCDRPSSFGSGRLVAPDIVLTARHVVGATGGPLHPGPLQVYRWTDLRAGLAEPIAATVAWEAPIDGRGRRADVVLLRLQGASVVTPELQLRFGRAPADPARAWVVGFPWLLALPERREAAGSSLDSAVLPGGIDEFNLPGTCFEAQAADARLAFKASVKVGTPREPAHDTASRWCGLSGGVVVIGDCVVGVMRRQDGRFAPDEELDVMPLHCLEADAGMHSLLPQAGAAPWPVATERAAHNPPPREVQELSAVLQTLDRMSELGRVGGLLKRPADGRAHEVVVHAQSADLPAMFFLAACEGPLARLAGHPLPPWECSWPTDLAGADAIEAHIARQLGYLVDDFDVERFDGLVTALSEREVTPPWVHLGLPPSMSTPGADVLERWRRAWATVAKKRRDHCGYFLSFDGNATDWQTVRMVLARDMPGIAQEGPLVLQPVRLEELVAWPNRLASRARLDPTEQRYSRLAAQLVPHIQVRRWVRFQPFDLQRVMIGDCTI